MAPALEEDGIVAYRTFDQLYEKSFVLAYSAAVAAVGWDYGIRFRTYILMQSAELARRRFGGEGTFVELGTGRGR